MTPSGDGPSLDATDIPLEDDDEDTPFAEPTDDLADGEAEGDSDDAGDDADEGIEADVEDELAHDGLPNDELTSDVATAADETDNQAAAAAVVEGSRLSPPKIRDQKAARASDAAKSASATPTKRKLGRRTTPKGAPVKAAAKSGRYTHPIPKEQRQSPPWFPWMLLGFLVLGLLTIVLNYVNVLPGGTNNWYLIGGIVLIVIGLFGATFYH